MTDQPTDQELSAWIAANVMGLVEGVDFWDQGEHELCRRHWSWDVKADTYCRRCHNYSGYRPTEVCHKPPPAYCEDMGLAWGVLTSLLSSIDGMPTFSLALWSGIKKWRAETSLATVDQQGEAFADTAPRALCLAIYKALEEPEPPKVEEE